MSSSPLSPIEIRLMNEDDFMEAERLLMTGYGGSPSRIPELKRLLEVQPDGWLLALREGQPSGMGGAVLYDRFAYIGMMVVLPHLQRQGIGRRIFEAILEWIASNHCHLALLDATEAGAALYRHYGFKEVDQARQYICQTPPKTAHPSRFVHSATITDLAKIAEFDIPIFGSNRERVFHAYWKDFRHRFLIKLDSKDQIRGYLLAQPTRLGAWAALTPDDASDLMEAAFALPYAGEVNVIAPAANKHAEQVLTTAGFRFERALPHMASTTNLVLRRRDLLYGQISFAIG